MLLSSKLWILFFSIFLSWRRMEEFECQQIYDKYKRPDMESDQVPINSSQVFHHWATLTTIYIPACILIYWLWRFKFFVQCLRTGPLYPWSLVHDLHQSYILWNQLISWGQFTGLWVFCLFVDVIFQFSASVGKPNLL